MVIPAARRPGTCLQALLAGAVRLSGAQIGGQLDCRGASLRNDSGPALAAASLAVGQAMFLANGFTAIGGGDAVVIDLTGAIVGGAFVLDPARLEHQAYFGGRLTVDGLTYAGLPQLISLQDWLRLLRDGTTEIDLGTAEQIALTTTERLTLN